MEDGDLSLEEQKEVQSLVDPSAASYALPKPVTVLGLQRDAARSSPQDRPNGTEAESFS